MRETYKKSVLIIFLLVFTLTSSAISSALKDTDSNVQESVTETPRKIKNISSIAQLIAMLKDMNSAVRKDAMESLVKIGKPAVSPMVATLKNENSYARMSAAEVLGNIRDTCAVDPLIDALLTPKEKNPNVRKAVAEALGNMGDRRAVSALTYALKDNDSDVRESIVNALVKNGNLAVEPLIASLGRDSAGGIRADTLVKIGKPAFEPLITVLKNENGDARRNAAMALGQIGGQEAVPELVIALQDWYVGKYAANALQKIGWQPQNIEDKVHYSVAMRKYYALKEKWEQTKSVLLSDLQSSNYRAKENAIYAIITLGKDDLTPNLINLLNLNGNDVIATIYLNSGNSELEFAAHKWAKENGYFTLNSFGVGGSVKWGSLK